MIPNNGASSDFEVTAYPTRTYELDFEKNRIMRETDGLAAMRQMVFKALQTDRYRYVIYDWNYGVDLDGMFGKPVVYVKSELVRRIKDCLMADDRVTGVDGFEYQTLPGGAYNDSRTAVSIRFTVYTVFGSISVSKDVTV